MSAGVLWDWTKYPNYEELTRVLGQVARDYRDMCTLRSLGRSWRGREVWLLELTNRATGSAGNKPGLYVDANMHAEELSGTSVALYLIHVLLTGYGQDPLATRALDETVFYVVPRLDPDGAEFVLSRGWPWCGNGRYLPGEEQPELGLYFQDLDGDGFVCQMRVPDPLGEWKMSERDPRIMVLREPDEVGGTYYRLLPEGLIRGWDGATVLIPRPRDGNLNRNYPGNFLPDPLQYGAGPFPLSEPETRGVADFLAEHPNVALAMSYHTNAGVILRPFSNKGDEHFHPDDLYLYQVLGRMGTEETGYPLISVYSDFTPVKRDARGGTLSDWLFEVYGIPVFVTELWDVLREAGIQVNEYYPSMGLSEEQWLKLLEFNDREMGGDGFVPWHPFDHPQLGKVEIGGWKRVFIFRNPPGHMVENMARRNARYVLRLAATLPRLRIGTVTAEPFAGDVWRVKAVVENHGYLSTYLTRQALEARQDDPPRVCLCLEGQAELVGGNPEKRPGHLGGRIDRRREWSQWGNEWGTPRRTVEWLVRVSGPAKATVVAQAARAGRASATVSLAP